MKKHYVLISGALRSGKDSCADFLCQWKPDTFCKVSLADELKDMEAELAEVYVKEWGVSVTYLPIKRGKALQYLGTEIGRKIDAAAWIKLLKARAQKVKQPVIVVPDCRFANEFFAQELLPGTRLCIYADEATIQIRLDKVGDKRKIGVHQSEKFSGELYREIRAVGGDNWKTQKLITPGSLISGVKCFNTSKGTGYRLGEYRKAVLRWGASFLKESGL